jgi:lysyl-tRNA synthetase class I
MSFAFKDLKNQIAEESPKTRKALEKLKRQMDAADKKITPQALQKKAIEIHRWIARHASNRIILKNKSICLFDENEHAAKLSQRMLKLADNLKREMNGSSEEIAAQFYQHHSTRSRSLKED